MVGGGGERDSAVPMIEQLLKMHLSSVHRGWRWRRKRWCIPDERTAMEHAPVEGASWLEVKE